MSISRLLRQRAALHRPGWALDALGDSHSTWSRVADGLPCAVEAVEDSVRVDAGGVAHARYARIFFDAGDGRNSEVHPAAGDRIEVDGVRWTVRAFRVEEGARARLGIAEVVAPDD